MYIQSVTENLNSGRPRTNPANGKVEGLNPGPPVYNLNLLGHAAPAPGFQGSWVPTQK